MNQKLVINPWLSIWTNLRSVIRALIAYNVNHRLIILCAIYGFQYMLHVFPVFSLGSQLSLLMIVTLAAILAIPIGYLVFNLSSFFVLICGKIIRGKGTFKQIRAASYWSSVPNIITGLIWIALMIPYGSALFIEGYAKTFPHLEAVIYLAIGVIQLGISIWVLVFFLKALGEVQPILQHLFAIKLNLLPVARWGSFSHCIPLAGLRGASSRALHMIAP